MTVFAAPESTTTMPVASSKGGVVVVRRHDDKLRAGQGMWKGMQRVIAHFGKSFTTRVTTRDETMGMFTEQYAEERFRMGKAFRNFPILLYDDASVQELCTSC